MDVRTLCLGTLMLGDSTGYEIRKMFEEGPFHHFLEASYGSIYPALTRLTEEELVTCHAEQQEKRPDKKVYSITRKGRKAFTDALMEPLAEDKFRSEFLFVMLFAHLLTPERVSALIDEKLAEYQQQNDRIEAETEIPAPGTIFVRELGWHMHKAYIDYLSSHRHLVEDIARAASKSGNASKSTAATAKSRGASSRTTAKGKASPKNTARKGELAKVR